MPKSKASVKKTVEASTKKVSMKKTVSYENGVEEFFVESLPALPNGVKEFLVSFGPWVVLVLAVLAIPSILAVFGWGAMMAPYGSMMGARWGYGYSLSWSWLISLVSFGLTVWALPGLFKRQMFAWRLMLYSTIVSAVGMLLSMQLLSLIIGTGLSLYILYQIKSYYK